MTVNVTESGYIFTGIIQGVPINLPMPVQAATDLVVRFGPNDTVASPSDYGVSLFPPDYDHAQIVATPNLVTLSGGTISVRRELPLTQPTDIPTLASLATARVEQMFDRCVMMVQQVYKLFSRVQYFPTTDPDSSIGPLPAADDRKLKFAAYDVLGKPIAAVGTVPTGPMTTIGLAMATAVDAAAERALIDAVRKSGDTMTGLLRLFGDPVNVLDAATKQFVTAGDAAEAAARIAYVAAQLGLLTVNSFPGILTIAHGGSGNNNIPQSLTSNGYVCLPLQSGVYFFFQWGQMGVGGGGAVGVVFPGAFTTGPYFIMVSNQTNGGTYWIDGVGTPGFTLHNPGGGAVAYGWIAGGLYIP